MLIAQFTIYANVHTILQRRYHVEKMQKGYLTVKYSQESEGVLTDKELFEGKWWQFPFAGVLVNVRRHHLFTNDGISSKHHILYETNGPVKQGPSYKYIIKERWNNKHNSQIFVINFLLYFMSQFVLTWQTY